MFIEATTPTVLYKEEEKEGKGGSRERGGKNWNQ